MQSQDVIALPSAGANSPRKADQLPQADMVGTFLFVVTVLVTWSTLSGFVPSELANRCAWGVGFGLALTAAFDLRHGARNLFRPDLFCLMGLYGLIYAEFLFPQPGFDSKVSLELARTSINATMVAFLAIAIGRHFGQSQKPVFRQLLSKPLPNWTLLFLFWLAAILAYLHMLIAINFNPIELIDQMMAPRFSQPWGRTRFGNWKALLYELNLLLYVIAPLGGIILAKHKRFKTLTLTLVGLVTLITIFEAFASGTRHRFFVQLIMFGVAYTLFMERKSMLRVFLIFGLMFGVMYFATNFMLAFRQIGLKKFMQGDYYLGRSYVGPSSGPVDERDELFVDANLFNISETIRAFPHQVEYQRWDIVKEIFFRPIPRALWSGKPLGLALKIEDAFAREGKPMTLTISITIVGEMWVGFGMPGVVVGCFVFGIFAGWWNRLAARTNSDLGFLIYVTGFLGLVISMRSIYAIGVFLLPTFAVVVFTWQMIRKVYQAQQVVRADSQADRLRTGRPLP